MTADCPFSVGDHVKVTLDAELFQTLQDGHGGWNSRMTQVERDLFVGSF